jgi:hypothetical protein
MKRARESDFLCEASRLRTRWAPKSKFEQLAAEWSLISTPKYGRDSPRRRTQRWSSWNQVCDEDRFYWGKSESVKRL